MQGQQLIMIGSHGNGRWTAMEGVFIMVGRFGGDQNLGFNSFVCRYCSYERKLGSITNKLLTSSTLTARELEEPFFQFAVVCQFFGYGRK